MRQELCGYVCSCAGTCVAVRVLCFYSKVAGSKFLSALHALFPSRPQAAAMSALDATYPLGRRTRRIVHMLFR